MVRQPAAPLELARLLFQSAPSLRSDGDCRVGLCLDLLAPSRVDLEHRIAHDRADSRDGTRLLALASEYFSDGYRERRRIDQWFEGETAGAALGFLFGRCSFHMRFKVPLHWRPQHPAVSFALSDGGQARRASS